MEKQTVTAKSKYIRQSPYKVRLVLNLIRGLNVNEALNILTFTKRKAATDIKQLLESAIANAENNFGMSSANLEITKAIADEGPTLKRFRPRARGSAGRINKRTSHILIELESVEEKNGSKNTSMYAFSDLSNHQIWQLIHYVRTFAK